MATTRKSTNKTMLVKLMVYSFGYGRVYTLVNGVRNDKCTNEKHRVILNKDEQLFDIDIHRIVKEQIEVLNLENGEFDFHHSDSMSMIQVDDGKLRSIGLIKEKDAPAYERTKYLVLSPSHFKTMTFYKVTFKTAIPKWLGLNGTDYEHTYYIDEPSYKHLCEYIDGDVL